MIRSEVLDKNQMAVLDALNTVNNDLLDFDRVFSELEVKKSELAWSENLVPRDIDLDEFDWAGIKFKTRDFDADKVVLHETVKPDSFNSLEFYKSIEAVISNGYLWEVEQDEYSLSPEFELSMGFNPRNHRRTDSQDINKLLRQFDRLSENEIDILSADDSIYETNYKVVNNFEINVPVKVYSEGEEWIIKANIPDIVLNNTSPGSDIFPEQLNFKSVLALLPERINTRQLQPTFVNGQFRLELPKREELRSSRVK